jgi:adenylate cyclase
MEPSDGRFEGEYAERGAAGRVVLSETPALILGKLRIEPSLRQVTHADGRNEIVEPRVMQVLVAMIRADGRILSRDELLARCWHGVVVGDDAINRVMGRLRRLADGIGDGAFKLETITKVGFRLVPGDHLDGVAPRAKRTDRDVDSGPLLAVLAFHNMSVDPEQEYFSDGITEDIITDLSKISSLKVIARNASFKFKGRTTDILEIGRELNAAHVLEGSVRKAGNSVRITAQLVEVATGVQIWAERWDRDLTNIFAIQDEISQAVVTALRLRLLPDEKQAIAHRETASSDAYNLYLMARQYRTSGNEGDPGREEAIIRLCRRAVEIDPDYAHAWAFMARSQSLLHVYYKRGDDDGLAAAERALTLDPNLAEAHAVKARHLINVGNVDKAFEELLIALRLDPECWEANKDAGLLSFRKKDYREAVRYYKKSSAVVDSDFASPMMLLNAYVSLGDSDSAREAARLTYARAEAAVSKDHSNGAATAAGCVALAFLGDAERARDWARRALLVDPDNKPMRYNLACALSAYLDDAEGAIQLLTVLFEDANGPWLKHARIDPDLDPIRDHPRYRALVDSVEARALSGAGARRAED